MRLNFRDALFLISNTGLMFGVFLLGAVFSSLLRDDLDGVRFFGVIAAVFMTAAAAASVTAHRTARKETTR